MYFRRKTSAGRAYLQIVESRRDGDQVRQQVIATLGRYEELQASGQLERLLQSGARFVAKAMVLAAAKSDETTKIASGVSNLVVAQGNLHSRRDLAVTPSQLCQRRERQVLLIRDCSA